MSKLFYISTDRGAAIRSAHRLDSAKKLAREEVGRSNVKEVREATEADIAWVRGMGGYIPPILSAKRSNQPPEGRDKLKP